MVKYNFDKMDVDQGKMEAFLDGDSSLIDTFVWEETPQGFYFWEDVREGTRELDVSTLAELGGQYYDWLGREPRKEGLASFDPVDKPEHYNHSEGIECIEYIKQVLGTEGFIAYCRGNVMKYNHRAYYKGNPTEDMAKAEWYLKRANEALKEG
jgi:hypothetical protein